MTRFLAFTFLLGIVFFPVSGQSKNGVPPAKKAEEKPAAAVIPPDYVLFDRTQPFELGTDQPVGKLLTELEEMLAYPEINFSRHLDELARLTRLENCRPCRRGALRILRTNPAFHDSRSAPDWVFFRLLFSSDAWLWREGVLYFSQYPGPRARRVLREQWEALEKKIARIPATGKKYDDQRAGLTDEWVYLFTGLSAGVGGPVRRKLLSGGWKLVKRGGDFTEQLLRREAFWRQYFRLLLFDRPGVKSTDISSVYIEDGAPETGPRVNWNKLWSKNFPKYGNQVWFDGNEKGKFSGSGWESVLGRGVSLEVKPGTRKGYRLVLVPGGGLDGPCWGCGALTNGDSLEGAEIVKKVDGLWKKPNRKLN